MRRVAEALWSWCSLLAMDVWNTVDVLTLTCILAARLMYYCRWTHDAPVDSHACLLYLIVTCISNSRVPMIWWPTWKPASSACQVNRPQWQGSVNDIQNSLNTLQLCVHFQWHFKLHPTNVLLRVYKPMMVVILYAAFLFCRCTAI